MHETFLSAPIAAVHMPGSSSLRFDGERLALAFSGKALVERTKIDHHSLMRSAADLFHLVARRHLELDPFSLDLDYLGFRTNIMTDGCSGKMTYVYLRTDR